MSDDVLKCKFCDWTVRKWTTRKSDKKRVYNYPKLVDHVHMHHEEEFDKVMEWICFEWFE